VAAQPHTMLLQTLPNVTALPAPEPKPATVSRLGTPHPGRRMLAEDKLETHEILIEPEEVKAQPDGWKKISQERTSQHEGRRHLGPSDADPHIRWRGAEQRCKRSKASGCIKMMLNESVE